MRKQLLRLLLFSLLAWTLVPHFLAQEGETTPVALEVLEIFPAPDSVTAIDAQVVIIFSRPVVPLVTSLDQASLPQPLTITPAVDGTGEWLNTFIYTFTPTKGFAGGTRYELRVDKASIQSADGLTLADDVVSSFTTEAPAISERLPAAGQIGVLLDDSVQVRFSQPMDRPSTERGFFLRLAEGSEAVAGAFTWSDDDAGFSFKPNEPLALDKGYRVGFTDEARAAGGGASLKGTTDWTFLTVPRPAIIATDPFDQQEGTNLYRGFNITFASPMNVETLKPRIKISPATELEPQLYYQEWSNTVSLSFIAYPDADYTVTIESGMEDIYGNKIELDQPLVVRYRTRGYDPDLSIRATGSVGLYNFDRDLVGLYLTHLNVSRVDLQLSQVDKSNFARILANGTVYNRTTDTLLATWQIPSVAPANATRFEFIDLKRYVTGGEVECTGALPTRLKVGDVAIVVADPNLRARSEAQTGEILELLYKDYQLPIVGGSVCRDGIRWWQVRLRDERLAWVAESVGSEYLLEVRFSAQTTPIQLPEGVGELEMGVYHLTAQSPELSSSWQIQRHLMIVANAQLLLKTTIDGVTVWATGLQSGQPLADVPITISMGNDAVFTGRTDADGVAQIALPRVTNLYSGVAAVLDDGTYFGVGYNDWTNGIDSYTFGQSADYYPKQYRVYVYTDRPVYRPNQPVYYRGVVREKDDVTYRIPANLREVPIAVYNYAGDILFEDTVSLTPNGTFSGSFTLAPDTVLGYSYIEARLPAVNEYDFEGGTVSFNVAQYRLPQFQVNVTPALSEVVQGDTIEVAIDSRYFFGGAVTNANITYSVVADTYNFNYTGRDFFSFADYNYDEGASFYYGSSFSSAIADGVTKSDASGMAMISLPASLAERKGSASYLIEASVRDETDQTVSGRTTVVVHQGLLYAGVRPLSYVSTATEPATLEVIAVDWESEPIANQAVSVRVVERRWSSVQERSPSGYTNWTWEVEELPILDATTLTTDANGLARLDFTPPRGGTYKAIVTSRDERGNEVVSSTLIWVSGREYVSWRQQNSNRIDLIADQTDYLIGDMAEVLITSPFQGTTEALVTVERGRVLKTERITMDTNSTIYRLPITEDYAPNVYVSVMLIKGVDENNPVAAFRMGYIQLGVETTRQVLTIDITSDTERAQPQQTVEYTVKTTDYTGAPVSAEVGVAVTDLASLSLAEPNSIAILQYFYNRQFLGVRTSTPLTINVDQVTQEILDTIKGGGGGFLEEGLLDVRGEFIDTPYWNATITTDANGEATFSVRLPDNLTTWRLDARAVANPVPDKLLVGQTTQDLVSTKPLIIRPITPRFFVVGDEVVLGAVINNNTGTAQDAVVTIAIRGAELLDDLSQRVTIPADGRARVNWRVRVENVSTLVATFRAESGDYSDATISPVSVDDKGTLPVYRYDVPEYVGTSGALMETTTRTEQVLIPADVVNGELKVKLDYSLAGATLDSLNVIKTQNYDYIEWAISRFLPNVVSYQALVNAGFENPELRAELDREVNLVLQKLSAEQKADGGWGWSLRDESSEYVTAYALIGLAVAREAGFTVNENLITLAQRFIQARFIATTASTPVWQLNRQAFMLYGLVRSGVRDVGRTSSLFDNYLRMDSWAVGLLAQTLHWQNSQDTRRIDTLVNHLTNQAITSATGIHWQEKVRDYYAWNTDTRSTAIALQTLVLLRPNSELLPMIVRHLMVQRRADSWTTSQETVWAVLALSAWMTASNELNPDYAYTFALNENEPFAETVTRDNVLGGGTTLAFDVADLLKGQVNTLAFERTGDAGGLYYTAHLRADLPVSQVDAYDKGIFLDRRYLNMATNETITEGRVGDLVQVRLTIIIPNARYYLVIEDPLPAGAEAVDPNLLTSAQIGTRPQVETNDPFGYGWGWWWFSQIQFRDDKVTLAATYIPAGAYEFRYTMRLSVAGTYQVIPTTGREFYFPEVYGRTAGSLFTVLPADE